MSNPISAVTAPVLGRPTEAPKPPAAGEEGSWWSSDGPNFGDLLDMINPLQHLPGLSIFYRQGSGDTIAHFPRLLGDAIYGGVLGGVVAGVTGIATAAANILLKEASGQDLGEHVMELLDGEAPDSAESAAPPPFQPREAREEEEESRRPLAVFGTQVFYADGGMAEPTAAGGDPPPPLAAQEPSRSQPGAGGAEGGAPLPHPPAPGGLPGASGPAGMPLPDATTAPPPLPPLGSAPGEGPVGNPVGAPEELTLLTPRDSARLQALERAYRLEAGNRPGHPARSAHHPGGDARGPEQPIIDIHH